MDFLANNKEWLFSGIGLLILGAFYKLIGFIINKKRKLKNLPLEKPSAANFTNTFAESEGDDHKKRVNSFSYIEDTINNAALDSGREYPQKVINSISYIYDTIKNTPLLHQKNIAKEFIGMKFHCKCKFLSADKDDTNNIRVFAHIIGEKEMRGIFFNIKQQDLPGIGLIKEGEILEITGNIAKVSELGIELENVKVI